ncbi:hypothetical protein SISSUDRAFT_972305, partial [Sistotremastrum suecicum HHB10207 ss-3]
QAKNPKPDNAYSGRSIQIKDGELSSAWMYLQRILRDNNVRAEATAQQRHEKEGPKRRRLRSERWRRRFAEEVRKKVRLVEAIRRRGA